jgi:formate hydrogenlyase subunit 6/NADH:ubiquinone oxidoreductase subunit I
MIKRLFQTLLLIDVIKSIWFGIKVALSKKPVTIKFPKEQLCRSNNARCFFCFDQEKCIKCRMCEKVCPCQAITVSDDYVFDSKKCAYCALCERVCPRGAIKFMNKKIQ